MSIPGYSSVAVPQARTDSRAVFGEVMGLVGITCLFAALGAYLGRNITGGASLLAWVVAIGCIFGLNAANSRNHQLALGLLFALGLALGFSIGAVINYYAKADPSALYQAAGATGLFVGALGAGGYATKRDLSGLYRLAFWLLVALLIGGIATIFIRSEVASLVYSVAGLGVFGLYVVIDFNRLRRAGQDQIVPLAAGIFLDIFNIFLFFLRIFGSSR